MARPRCRFTPLPHLPADHLGPMSYGPLADLYLRAHKVWWREFEITQRELVEAWGMPRRQVWRILDKLVDLGFAVIEKGTRRRATLITVYDPTTLEMGPDGAVHSLPSSAPSTGPELAKEMPDLAHHNYQGSTVDTGRSGPQHARFGDTKEPGLVPTDLPGSGPTLYETETETEQRPNRTETEAEVSSSPTAPDQLTMSGTGTASGPTKADVVASLGGYTASPGKPAAPAKPKSAKVNKRAVAQRIYEAYRLHHPQNAEVPSRGDAKKLVDRLTDAARMLKGKRARYRPEDWTTAEQDLIDLSEWVHLAPDAKFWRGDNRDGSVHLGITPIYKEDKFSDRLQKMVAWRKGGRGTKARTYSGDRGDIPPAPEPVGPQTTGPQWKRLSELDDIVKDKASTSEQVTTALAEIELIESNPGAPLP